ncbi:UNVERIFIED_CONTAM: putative pectin methyltransferase QUA2 [Sesamum radiatum]|uniref:Methyltransferase n=1 Tax=Sesamum radiatum TaxID=300843 RepID=A0AAW2M253_SESRA
MWFSCSHSLKNSQRPAKRGTALRRIGMKDAFNIFSDFRKNVEASSSGCISLGDHGFISDPFGPGAPRSLHKVTLCLLKFSLAVIVILALIGSFWWTLSVTSMSRGKIVHGYRRLQEQLVSDLYEIGGLSIGSSRLRELEYCSEESENYVPCFNVSGNLALGFSDGEEYARHCGHRSKQNCLVLPPVNYRIPLRWPTGRDVIWYANVNITAQEVLSSGSLTKRMMMLDEDQISFRSVSSTFDVEDYSHQIAEIGLRNESYFIQAVQITIFLCMISLFHLTTSLSLCLLYIWMALHTVNLQHHDHS